MTFNERVPPQNLEAEQSVLGSLLVDADVVPVVRQIVTAEDFYAERHQRVYGAMGALADKREPIDLITVQAELAKRQHLDGVGLDYLTELMNSVPTTANVEAYARIVADKADLRRIQTAARKVVERSYGDVTSDDLKTYSMSELQGAIFHRGGTGVRSVGSSLLEFIETARNAAADGKPPAGLIQNPFKRQHHVMPKVRGETTAVGAGSNIGKTTYMFNEMLGCARLGEPTIGFSLEMSDTQVLQKYWARVAGINTLSIRHGALNEDEWARSTLAAAKMLGLPLHYMVRPRMTWTQIEMESRAFAAKHGRLSNLYVDYWQILPDKPSRDERRDSQLGRLVEHAKALAVELNCHVTFLVQTRIINDQPVPTLADVLESRDIVRYADNALFLTRPIEFGSAKLKLPAASGAWVEVKCDDPYPHIELRGEKFRGTRMFDNVMIGVQGKQRMGPKDIIPYWIDLPTGKMTDLATPWPWDNPMGKHPNQQIPE